MSRPIRSGFVCLVIFLTLALSAWAQEPAAPNSSVATTLSPPPPPSSSPQPVTTTTTTTTTTSAPTTTTKANLQATSESPSSTIVATIGPSEATTLAAAAVAAASEASEAAPTPDSNLTDEEKLAKLTESVGLTDLASVAAPGDYIDLSHTLDDNTLHWPTNKGFRYSDDGRGELKGAENVTYYYKSDSFSMAIHAGTHLDAPRHFGKDAWTVDQIPLERLINVPVQVIDLSAKVQLNRSYSFRKEDFIDQACGQPLVSKNSVVLVYTGISKLYNQGHKEYFGTETKNYNEMRIPGFSKEAAQFLVDSGVYGVGLDAPSADSSDRHSGTSSINPVAHAIFNTNNVFILENINQNLGKLVGSGADLRLTAIPLPIRDGSGSPVRLVAQTNSAYGLTNQLSLYGSLIMALISYLPVDYFH